MKFRSKKYYRLHRAMKTKSKLKKLHSVRLVVHRTSRHIYAQIISSNNSDVLVSASTVEKDISNLMKYTGNKDAASIIGKHIALRALEKGISKVSFDRSGFKYHGRILALAQTARDFGLNF